MSNVENVRSMTPLQKGSDRSNGGEPRTDNGDLQVSSDNSLIASDTRSTSDSRSW